MTRIARRRLWTVSATSVALCVFVAGTSLACLRGEVATAQMAQECCLGHCQHAMAAEMATQCCQGHQAGVSQVLPLVSTSKTVSLAVDASPIAVIPPAGGQTARQLRGHLSPRERPPRLPALYTLHCALLL
ncbi:MAG: hypothetical protein NZ578_05000 [Candidatus Binatia bacterium]|nr:hypothetical protein [Candidatus Binatia bacterium]